MLSSSATHSSRFLRLPSPRIHNAEHNLSNCFFGTSMSFTEHDCIFCWVQVGFTDDCLARANKRAGNNHDPDQACNREVDTWATILRIFISNYSWLALALWEILVYEFTVLVGTLPNPRNASWSYVSYFWVISWPCFYLRFWEVLHRTPTNAHRPWVTQPEDTNIVVWPVHVLVPDNEEANMSLQRNIEHFGFSVLCPFLYNLSNEACWNVRDRSADIFQTVQ